MDECFGDFKTMGGVQPVEGVTVKSVSLDNVMMTYMEFKPGAILPEHKHPHEQITLIAEGRMELTVGQTTKVMAKGEVVKVPPNTPHRARVLNEPVIAIDAWSPIRQDYKPVS